MTLWLLLTVAVFSVVFFVFFGRRDEQRVENDWKDLLQSESSQVVDMVQRNVGTGMEVVDFNFEMAHQLKKLNNVDDAIHLLGVGYEAIQQFVPNLMILLSIMVKFSRMVAALTPLDPLDPADFKTGQIAGLAYLHRWLNHLARTVRDGFRLRLFILSKGIGITSKHLFYSTRRVILRRSEDEREWEQIDAIRHDMGRLTQESVDSFRWMMSAISAHSRRELSQQLLQSGPASKS